jgi:hypothetical protein
MSSGGTTARRGDEEPRRDDQNALTLDHATLGKLDQNALAF